MILKLLGYSKPLKSPHDDILSGNEENFIYLFVFSRKKVIAQDLSMKKNRHHPLHLISDVKKKHLFRN